jgi:hypothetical protein
VTLLAYAVLHLALTVAPGVACVSVAVRRECRDTPALLAVGIAGVGAAAVLAFWAYFADPTIGDVCAYAIPLASVLVVVACRRGYRTEDDPGTGRDSGRDAVRGLLAPLALWVFAVLFLLYLGFLHGGESAPLQMSANRFSHLLPTDNVLPFFFSNAIYLHAHSGPFPHFADWLSSDRPPLQMGFILAQRTFAWDTTGLHYEVLGVALQQLWVVGLWAFLCAARVQSRTRALVVVAVLLSDTAIVNGFYVWPKMVGAAFLFAAAALVLTDAWSSARYRVTTGALVGVLLALAMLTHGTSVFGVIPLAVLALVRGAPSWRWLAAAGAAALALYAPWLLYQRYVDPPGNRLVKYQLAGVQPVDGRGALETIVDAYEQAGWHGTLDKKIDNYVTMAGGHHVLTQSADAVDDFFSGRFEAAVRNIRKMRFFGLLPAVGVFLVAPFVMLAMRKRERRAACDWVFALTCFAYVVIGAAIWGLLIFGPPTPAVIHVGSLALPVLLLAGCVAGLANALPRLTIAFVAVHGVFALVLYGPAFDPLPGTHYSVPAALLGAGSLAAFVLIAWRSPNEPAAVRERAPVTVSGEWER